MDELMLKARLLEKNMAYAQPQAQPTGQQPTGQDKNNDGLDDGSGLPVKRVTTITEDINNKTGKVAQREQKTKITNPTAMFDAEQADNRASDGVATNVVNGVSMKSDEMIEFYMGQLEKGMLGRMGAKVSNFLSGADTQQENYMEDPNNPGKSIPNPNRMKTDAASNPSIDSDVSLGGAAPAAKVPPANVSNAQPPQPVGGTQTEMQRQSEIMSQMPGAGGRPIGAAQSAQPAQPGAQPVGGNYLPPNTQLQEEAQRAAGGSYMPVHGGFGANLKNMASHWLTGVTPKSLGGRGQPLTGNLRTNMLAGQEKNLGLDAAETREEAGHFRTGDQKERQAAVMSDPRYASSGRAPPPAPPPAAPTVRPPNPHEAAIMSSSDVIDPDFYAVLKYKREMRERQSTEAIRIGSL